MSCQRRDSQAGLTLVEVLVALSLFAMIGLAGFSMLDTILRVRSGTETRLERLAEIDRSLVIFSRDLQQADPGSVVQSTNRVSILRPGSGLISYLILDGALVRRVTQAGADQRVLDGVEGLGFRALDAKKTWHENWPVEQIQVLGEPPVLRALEMRLLLQNGEVTRLVDVAFGSAGQ